MTYAMTIDGRATGSPAGLAVRNPATGAVVGQAPDCSDEQLDAAVGGAGRALAGWRADEPARRAALRASAERLRRHAEELARLLTAEQGKPIREARQEIIKSAGRWSYFAGLELDRHALDGGANGGTEAEIRHDPLGVVAVITPWNYPVNIATNRVAPALLSGNTVVLKPSPYAPLTTLRIGRLLADLYPAGVLNVVSGEDGLGARLAGHPLVRAVSFTGSTRTGKRVAAAAAADLKRVLLELGGNDAAVVLPDADPERVADGLVASAFANCGQVCYCVKRVYASRVQLADLVAAVVERVGRLRVGDGGSEDTDLGPINNRPQLDRVDRLVAAARTQGAVAECGGHRLPGPGNFYAPTVLTGCTDDMEVVREEQFGPVLPILPYDSVDEAVRRANATCYGLGGSVWTGDLAEGRRVATRIDASTVWLNTHGVVGPAQPHSGVRHSGLGIVGGGGLGLLGVTDLKVIARQAPRQTETMARS